MENSFIKQVAGILMQACNGNFKDTAVVFSNRRAKTFLTQALIELHTEKNFWLPQIFSTDDFIQHFTRKKQADNFQLQVILYQAYAKVLGEQAEVFDEFVQWAAMMLNDFDEVDQHLTDADKLFNYLSDAKALEIWNVNGAPLTKMQKSYLVFFQNLAPIYHQFKQLLADQNMFYRGMIYKELAENIERSDELSQFTNIYFCGLNALLFSEKVIIKKLLDKGIAKLIWDTDEYYLHNSQQEAGNFLRSNEKLFGKIESLKSNAFLDQKKKIEVVAAELQSGQVNFLAEYLRTQNQKNRLNQTAVILADESIADAVLQALPQEIREVNFTVGYSLSKSVLAQWIISIFNLKAHIETNFELKIINTQLIRDVFKNKLFEVLFSDQSKEIESVVMQYQKYITHADAFDKSNQFDNKRLFNHLFVDFNSSHLNYLQVLINNKNLVIEKLSNKSNEFLFVHEVFEALHSIFQVLSSCDQEFSANFIAKAVQSKFSEIKIPFEGKPYNQLQIMGILETRNLDFEDIIFLSTNEGVLPESNFKKSFITNDIKSIFNMPTGIDREAVFSYHFYRLLQRAQNITLVYNATRTDDISGEPSRYIMQLEKEWPLASSNLTIRNYKPIYSSNNNQIITVENNDRNLSLLKVWSEKGISFSAINTYLKCSLQFYFKYLLRLKTVENELEQTDEMDLGIIVHESLETIYRPFINTKLSLSLKQSFEKLELIIEEVIQNNFPTRDFKSGSNLLLKIAAKHLIQKLIQFDINQIEKGDEIILKGVESKLTRTYTLSNGAQVVIAGTFDRIDDYNETPRIIDYKTGVVSSTLKIKNIEDIYLFDNDKQRQLLVYKWISGLNNAVSGIIPLQNLKSGLKELSIDESLSIDELIEGLFTKTLEKIFNVEEYFVQTEDMNVCQYCDYNTICKRVSN